MVEAPKSVRVVLASHVRVGVGVGGLDSLFAPWMVWAWEEATPLSTMGSRRARATRPWEGMRQKASAEPASMAAAAEREATDFIVCWHEVAW